MQDIFCSLITPLYQSFVLKHLNGLALDKYNSTYVHIRHCLVKLCNRSLLVHMKFNIASEIVLGE